jgi:acyl transferase domain-containing protein/NAD(P)H-dependent flavin oxidoreductase YrpB (nitropropane dioxygenase family)
MTRVSDTVEFALEVAQAGGLPFLALALMRGLEVSALMEQCGSRLARRPWGVGILGFVPPELRDEQLEIVRRFHPPFALIAGGRPDQCQDLEHSGISTYLHVPSPTLLRTYLASGTRRFVFEGRECGGHVGPRSSFVLWNSMIDTLLECLPDKAEECHVLFAGGIHDALSASMVSVLAAPLAERGVRIGVLLGTAYLFTREAVTSGAVVPVFQEEALACAETRLLESGPGHSIRCVDTPYTEFFEKEKRRLRTEGKDGDEIRALLEELNLGRLRIASKGIRRNQKSKDGRRFENLTPEQQRNEGMYMIGQVAALRDHVCSIRDLHEDVSAGAVNRLEFIPAERSVAVSESHKPGVAIIGMGCLLPKARDLHTYWNNILGKVDAVTEIPSDRWDWRQYFHEDPKAKDKVYSRWGGFLEEIPFDPLLYGMQPSSVPSTEPLQLLTLEAVRMALQDAGYATRPFPRERTAVILGVGGGSADLGLQYAFRAALPMFSDSIPPAAMAKLPEWTENSFPGILLNVVAGRVANRFDLGGVNYTVDGACASSLAALYQAVRELETGSSDLAITGGADTLQSPFAYMCFSKTNALSPRGRCRTFDESADGIAISEGLVILVLKRLADAERDGDRIYAVVKGVAGSSDGKDKGLTAPRREGQERALERAYAQAGISPADVALMEAHGTGTVVGDRVEIEALTEVYRKAGATARSCAVGSVKSNIGHTKSSAGAAGLAKAAMALHHKILPPTIGVTTPNKVLSAESPFYVNTEARPWIAPADGNPRRAAVSAFGFGGTNFHAVLEEYPASATGAGEESAGGAWPSELLLFAADSKPELSAMLRALDDALARGANPKLADLAYTYWRLAQSVSQSAMKLAVVASSVEDLRQRLAAWDSSSGGVGMSALQAQGIYFSGASSQKGGKVAFLFPGQGSQYPGMLGALAMHFPEVRCEFELADRALAGRFPRPLSSYIFPPPSFGAEEERATRRALTQTNIAQPALGAAGMSLFRLLEALGVPPDMAAGHSYGEYVALCAAGVFSEESLCEISEARGRYILANSTGGDVGMAAVAANRTTVEGLLHSLAGVWIANLNAPSQTVVSGTKSGIEQASARCEAAGLSVRALEVSCAFHSPLVAAARDRLAEALSRMEFSPQRFTVFSNSTAAPYPNEAKQVAGLLSNHLVSLVNFAGEIEAMYEAGARIFLEAGPRNALTGLVAQILKDRPHSAFALDVPGRPAISHLQDVLGELVALGVPVKLDRLYRSRKTRMLNLSSLVEDTREPALSPTSWLVDGGKARPAASPRPANAVQSAASAATVSASSPAPVLPATKPYIADPPAPPLPAAPNGHGDTERMLMQFQQVMTRMIETQREVMLAYLQPGENGNRSHSVAPFLGAATPVASNVVTQVAPALPSEPSVTELPTEQPVAVKIPTVVETIGVAQRLLGIVSERTGYPLDALGLDLKIEADLGVDSLKTSEILAAFQQACNTAEQPLVRASMERLTKTRTLRAMIELLEAALNGAGKAVSVVESAPAPKPAVPSPAPLPVRSGVEHPQLVPRSRLVAIEAPACRHRASAGGSYLITDDEQGVAALLAAELRRRGARVSLVRFERSVSANDFSTNDDDAYAADLSNPEAVSQLVGQVRQHQGSLSGIIHLLPIKPASAFEHMNSEAWRARVDLDVKSLFLLASAAAPDLKAAASSGSSRLVSATTMGGSCGIEPRTSLAPSQGGLAGILKCLALEWSGVQCKAVDFEEHQAASKLVPLLLDEISADDNEVEVGYRGSQRLVLRSVEARRDEIQEATQSIDRNSVILVTGGGRGITAELARELAGQYQPTLLIVGRSPFPEGDEDPLTAGLSSPQEVRAALFRSAKLQQNMTPAQADAECRRVFGNRDLRRNLSAMRNAGAKVEYFSVDVRNETAFGGLIQQLYGSYGRIDGVVHGAGVIEDRLIEDKKPESFDRVFDTKVSSAFTLSQALDPKSLKFLVFFSSIAACFGNTGQADYAAANGVLDKLAAHLDRSWQAHVFSVNWGPWAETGMVSPALHGLFVARGIDPIATRDGVRSLDWEMRNRRKGEGGVILGRGPWSSDQLAA